MSIKGGSRTSCSSPHAEDSAVEVQGFLGILDPHHGLLHDEVLAALVGLRDVGLCVGTWNTLLLSHSSYSFTKLTKLLRMREDPFCTRSRTDRGQAEGSAKKLAMDEEISEALSLPEVGYSRVWEDHRVLSKALAIQPHDTVLCITR